MLLFRHLQLRYNHEVAELTASEKMLRSVPCVFYFQGLDTKLDGGKWKENTVLLYYKKIPSFCSSKIMSEEHLWIESVRSDVATLQWTIDLKSVGQAYKPKIELLNSITLTSLFMEAQFSPRCIYTLLLLGTSTSRLYSYSYLSKHYPTTPPCNHYQKTLQKDPKYG